MRSAGPALQARPGTPPERRPPELSAGRARAAGDGRRAFCPSSAVRPARLWLPLLDLTRPGARLVRRPAGGLLIVEHFLQLSRLVVEPGLDALVPKPNL